MTEPNATSCNQSDDGKSEFISTQTLVSGNNHNSNHKNSNDKPDIFPFLGSDVGLSFWGGIDETTGIVIDASHPLCGRDVSNTILALPSGRGSCTASQVLLELILNQKAPRALVLRDRDGLICVGALVAKCCVLPETQDNQKDLVPVLDILQVEEHGDSTGSGEEHAAAAAAAASETTFGALIQGKPNYGCLLPDGKLVVGTTVEDVERKLETLAFSPKDNKENKTEIESKNRTNHSSKEFEFDLSPEEQRMLRETSTEAERRAMEVLIRYARIVTPPPTLPTYIDVTRAHIDGCTYIGPGGLRFVEGLVQDGGKVKIPTTLNSVSTDLRYWKKLGIEDDSTNQNSIRQADAYVALGCSPKSFTCAPYLLDNIGIPQMGDQIVWGESNAVVYANTVLGARTEKYADYLDICCAISGKVPQIGVHLEEPRKPTMVLSIEKDVLINVTPSDSIDNNNDDEDSFSLLFPILGHLCGSLSDGEVPLLTGLEDCSDTITLDHLKAFCAAFGTTAASPLIHIAGVTPEARLADVKEWKTHATRTKNINAQSLQETYHLLDQQTTRAGEYSDCDSVDHHDDDTVDLIALGNPHLSLSEVDELLRLVEKQSAQSEADDGISKKSGDVNVLACISRALYDLSPNVKKLEDFGITFVRDTCW